MAGAGYKLFVNGNALPASDLNTYVQQQTVMVFASASARTTALSGVLAEGMVSYRTDSHVVEVYNGTSWVAPGASSPLTTKGDLWGYSTTDARVPVGTDGQALLADSTQTTGLRWGSSAVALQEQIFTSSGTWTAPTGVTKVWLLVVGGGGGGTYSGGGSTNAGGDSSFSTVTGAGGQGGGTPTGSGPTALVGQSSYGPGGAAGTGNAAANTGGGGGGGTGSGAVAGVGGAQKQQQFTVSPSTGYTVTIGAGGANSYGAGGAGGSGIVLVRWLA